MDMDINDPSSTGRTDTSGYFFRRVWITVMKQRLLNMILVQSKRCFSDCREPQLRKEGRETVNCGTPEGIRNCTGSITEYISEGMPGRLFCRETVAQRSVL